MRQSYISDLYFVNFYSDIIVMDIDTVAGVNTITQSSVRSSSSKESALKYTKLSGGGTLSAASFACSFFTLLIAIDVAFSITQLVIGVLFKDSCPMNYLIPIYLIVAGAIGLVLRIIMILLVSSFLIKILIIKLILFDKINLWF
jgi:hypothetical protein